MMNAARFPEGFFRRSDEAPDGQFYSWPRIVTHIDDQAIAAVGDLYRELSLDGRILDIMSSWVSHFIDAPRELVVLGMNAMELGVNDQARAAVVHDLNASGSLPFADDSFDGATCCVSVDYLTNPIAVFADLARVLKAGATFVCTFSNRCFPTKAIAGWLETTDEQHCAIVAEYFRLAGGFEEPVISLRTPGSGGDPLFGVWASRSAR
jgi:SAM-dependent methyltransferase